MSTQVVVGLMSGTSLDGVDAAMLVMNGESIVRFGPGLEFAYTRDDRTVLQDAVDAALAWRFDGDEPSVFKQAERILTETHTRAVQAVCASAGMSTHDLDLVGFHGQTVIHLPPEHERPGRTRQLGDGASLAKSLGCAVAFDFRTADMAAGGQGAPLVPVYHRALCRVSGLEAPIGILNIGGVANLTCVGSDGALNAFDTGPGNGLLDAWIAEKTGGIMDKGGALSARGRVLEAGLQELMSHPHFLKSGPRSLDRWDFSLDPARNLSIEDGAATLAAFTARTVAMGVDTLPERPERLIVCGGGRKNTDLMARIARACALPVMTAEQVGWRGDLVEAEAFAYLAACTKAGQPISWPGTTGVPSPLTGGQIALP